MNFLDATYGYEGWLGNGLKLVERDLEHKHELMAEALFPFLRATYYRWAQTWGEHAGALAEAPRALAVGDLHVENYGTWRDAEGRLVWGINDFDEATQLPCTFDLTRLAVSAVLAGEHHGFALTRPRVAALLLEGYAAALECGGRPVVLEERHEELRTVLLARLRQPAVFWKKLNAIAECESRPPKEAQRLLGALLPDGVQGLKIVHRVAGLGSLGRQRYTAIGQLDGGFVAREVKPLAPPASAWAIRGASPAIRYGQIVKRSVRCQDPFLRQRGGWIGRRLSPYNGRVELDGLTQAKDAEMLLHAMGFEAANVHLGSIARKKLAKAHAAIRASEFARATRQLENALRRDWKEWRAH
jgi:hypothetical protein